MKSSLFVSAVCLSGVLAVAVPATADTFSFSTGDPDGRMASAARPDSPGKFEIESADDFVLTASQTSINSATFTGLLTGGATASVGQVKVEIYRVFPSDSDVNRTSGPPTFSTVNVPTRVNSPSDVAFAERSITAGTLSVTTTVLSPVFTASNSVQPGGIHPLPNVLTGGNGPITGQEVLFHITFTTPFNLPPDHYFFVPQVQVDGGEFLWLSAPRPIPGNPFPPGSTDLQSWTRDDLTGGIEPDWLRIGTDIVGGGSAAPTFNAAFSLDGVSEVPLPAALPLFASGLGALGLLGWRRKRKAIATA